MPLRRDFYREIGEAGGEKAVALYNLIEVVTFSYFQGRRDGQDAEVVTAIQALRRTLSPLHVPSSPMPVFAEHLKKEYESFRRQNPQQIADASTAPDVLDRALKFVSDFSGQGFSVATVFERPHRVCEGLPPGYRGPSHQAATGRPHCPAGPVVYATLCARAAHSRARMRTPSLGLTGTDRESNRGSKKEKKVRRSSRVDLVVNLGFSSDEIEGEAHVTNISTGGCRAESEINVAEGLQFVVLLHLPGAKSSQDRAGLRALGEGQ